MKAAQDNYYKLFESLKTLKEDPGIEDKSIIKIIEINAEKKQRRTGAAAQLKLELQMHSLKAEIDFL